MSFPAYAITIAKETMMPRYIGRNTTVQLISEKESLKANRKITQSLSSIFHFAILGPKYPPFPNNLKTDTISGKTPKIAK